MGIQLKRVLSKKVNFRLNIASIIAISMIIIIFYIILTSKCQKEEEEIKVKKSKYRLIIVILTRPDGMKNRDAIRKTWMSDRIDHVKHLFVIGMLDSQLETRETLQSEQDKFNDLLLLPKLQDHYGSLTKKVLQAFQVIYDDYEFDYLLKCDDDTFVLVPRVLNELDNWDDRTNRKELYWGFFNGKAQVKRSGPWKEAGWNLCDYYLPYAVGGGYVLSYNLVKFIASNAERLRMFNSEDVSVGLWLAPVANVERKHDVKFDTEYRSRGCSNKYIVTHKQGADSMQSLHDYYQNTGVLCSKEIRSRMSYNYNWTVPPSQCCNRQAGII